MPREFTLELVELKPEPRDRGKTTRRFSPPKRRGSPTRPAAITSSRSTSAAKPGPLREFAAKLAAWRERALAVAFVIGSADGLDPAVKRNADAVLALSALTLPHGLARVVLAEQLYRATSLLSGHPYHRE